MRAYTASDEEALRARELLKDWAGEGFLSQEQYQQMKQETPCDLRRTNIFLRIVLFLFTLIIVGAAVGLFYVLTEPAQQTAGVLMLIFAAAAYWAAEVAVSQFKLYRHGIEEALVVCSVGFLCVGLYAAFFSGAGNRMEFLVLAAGAIASLWIWHRFGLPYAFLAAMYFALWLPGYWIQSGVAQHLIAAAIFGVGLVLVASARTRHRLTFLDHRYSIAEALLWLGIYLAVNLQLSALNMGIWSITDFSGPFYWTTWVLTWCVPPIVLARGLRTKDRFVILAGAVTAILTLATNKSYLGWQRNTWDPMLLGALLIGVALLVRRWLANTPDGVRHGFTARRLSGRDKQWMNAGASAFGLAPQQQIATNSPVDSSDVDFGGELRAAAAQPRISDACKLVFGMLRSGKTRQ